MFPPGHKKLTPVMRQYKAAKEAYPDAILFFRLGDFYEMFNDDAVIAARELSITLTSRSKSAPEPVPMAGVPYHSAHQHLARLIAAGHKVAICEQMGDPSQIKGIVPRKVVRVLTPGLLTDTGQLDAKTNNFLCAVEAAEEGGRWGLSWLDVSTGELRACVLPSAAMMIAELARADPRETLVPEEALTDLQTSLPSAVPHTTVRADGALEPDVRPWLDEGVAAPLYDDAMAAHPPLAVRAVARALRFARRYLPDAELPVRRVGHYDPRGRLHLDETAQRHLELIRGADDRTKKGSLLETIDRTVTAAGGRRLRRWLLAPLLDVAAIRRRHDAVELFVRHPRTRDETRACLRRIGDVERLATRASLREATPRELGALAQSLDAIPAARAAIAEVAAGGVRGNEGIDDALELDVDGLPDLAALLARALVDDPPALLRDGGSIREGYDDQLDAARSLRRSGAAVIRDLEARLREQTQIGSLKVKHTRAFGWYIEVTKAHLDKVPSAWRRRQTLTGSERYLDDELEAIADQLSSAEERFAEREAELFTDLVNRVAKAGEGLRHLAAVVAMWDVYAALAELAHERDYCRPVVDDGDALILRDARHPVVERFVPAGRFVPNDTELSLPDQCQWIITGPNMAGKSTLMRQVALVVILAQMGSFVPAASARVGVVDRVLSRVGASDNLARGESTFMVEMRETARILRDVTSRSLVILDEIGRGTSTFDGLSIAWAVAEHLYLSVGCRALFATHYHQLTELANLHEGIANYSVSAREHEGEIVLLHRLTAGAVSRSYGIAVARLAGLPVSVLTRAEQLLKSLTEASTRGGAAGIEAQLDLFGSVAVAPPPPAPPPLTPDQAQVLAEVVEADVSRTTPMAALALLDDWQRRLEGMG
ncbi:MAG: DNA mismatch repair protein MutS [Myxococcota bacterium]